MLLSSLPDYDGETSSDKIAKDIVIYRDSVAIPYIVADNDLDASFALGYLHAQERMFSMDFARRAGKGKLSEILGYKALPFDRMFLTIGLNRDAKEIVKKINPVSLDLLKAYSEGVNLYIKEFKGHYPVEFDILGYDPEVWKPEDSIIMIRLMAWQLNISWWVDFAFSDIILKLGEDKALQILPAYDENNAYIIPAELKKLSSIPLGFMKTDMAFREFAQYNGNQVGSNGWIVSSIKSSSGKPIIANDPHLAFSAPGRWYAAVIKSGNETVAGVTLPGVPGVVIGKNNDISWALTNIMADDADFYVENVDSTGEKYLFNGQLRDIKTLKEKIKIKNQPDEDLIVRYTHRGPIISDIHPYTLLYKDKGISIPRISMRWTGNDFSDELFSFYKINKAKNWDDFKVSAQSFTVPGQNFIYGDKEGNTGYVFGAKLPARTFNNPTFIYDGTTDKYDWKGFVPQNELPVLFNPAQNYIASANNKTIKDFKYHISNLWEPSSRIERINQLLTNREKHSVDDFKDYQMDLTSPYSAGITHYILNAFSGIIIKDRNLKLTLELFSKWDFELDQFSQVPAIYSMFLKHLLKNTYYDEMGKDLFNEFLFMVNIPYRSMQQLLNNENHPLFDNLKTSHIENRDEIIRRSLSDALTELESKYGKEINKWQWGNFHKVTFKHTFSGVSKLLDEYIDIGPFEVGGDGTTIFNTQYAFNEGIKEFPRFDHSDFENDVGPSMRYIFDFSKPDVFYLVLTTGESGNLMSRHYKDMSEMWLYGNYIKIRTDEKSFSRNPLIFRILKR